MNGVNYDGFGAEIKLSRKLNFFHLISQLCLHASGAVFEDRAEQAQNNSFAKPRLGPVRWTESCHRNPYPVPAASRR